MKIIKLIKELNDRQIQLKEKDGKLLVNSPEGVLTEELSKVIRSRKEELLSFLIKQSSFQSYVTQNNELNRIVRKNKTQCALSFAQQRMWLMDKMTDGSTDYNMPFAFKVDGCFQPDVAEEAISRIIHRHEALRTVFVELEDGPQQKILNDYEFKLEKLDLVDCSPREQTNKVNDLVNENLHQKFCLETELMIKVKYVCLSRSEKVQSGILLFNMHHIASDGWSKAILIKEFINLYQFILNNDNEQLEELAVQYSDYAQWQSDRTNSESFKKQLDYWSTKLESVPVVHNLSLDKNRPPVKENGW